MRHTFSRMSRVGAVVVAVFFLASAETNFSRLNGFEPRFLPPVNNVAKNVKTGYGAKGDGVTDDTKAFLDALGAGRTIYIPAGTYLIKDQIRTVAPLTVLIGECRSTTVLKLADNAVGFNNPAVPKAFIHTRNAGQFGEQNFMNSVYHLTLLIGRGNPGAVGLNFHTNNTGELKDLAVRATDPVNNRGLRGIAFDDYWFGPGGGRYLEVEGFKNGIYINSAQNHTTLEYINITNCDTAMHIQVYPDTVFSVSCRKLVTTTCNMAINNGGQLTLVESQLGGSGPVAINNEGSLLCHTVTTSGFTKAIASTSPTGDLAGPDIDHYTSHPVQYNWPPAPGYDRTLGLPVKDAPEFPYPSSAAGWSLIGTTGDVGQLTQTAIDGGATDILLVGGTISSTITLRNAVRRVMGMGSLWITTKVSGGPVFRVADGTAPAVSIELVVANYGSSNSGMVEQASKRPVVLRNGFQGGYKNTTAAAGGDVFLESVCGSFTFTGINAWCRDINTEGSGIGVTNDNSKLWILGHKTEAYSTKIRTINGGFTELLGGVYRQTWPLAQQLSSGVDTSNPPPVFIVDNSNASLSFHNSDCYGESQKLTGYDYGQYWYRYSVREIRSGVTRSSPRTKDLCGAASLYVGYTQLATKTLEPGLRGRIVGSAALVGDPRTAKTYDVQGRKIAKVKGTMLVVRNGRLRLLSGVTSDGSLR